MKQLNCCCLLSLPSDNAYDPDVSAKQIWIDKTVINDNICLTFTDNGNGMNSEKLHKMLRWAPLHLSCANSSSGSVIARFIPFLICNSLILLLYKFSISEGKWMSRWDSRADSYYWSSPVILSGNFDLKISFYPFSQPSLSAVETLCSAC